MSSRFDAVVIGSGISGLTCGAFLARAGMRVCVLERHTKIGGYAHSFNRGRFRFESGIHSIPLAPDGFVFHLLRLLGVADAVSAVPHDSMFSFTCNGESYRIPAKLHEITTQLENDFPLQRGNLRLLFKDMQTFYETLIEPLFHFEERFTERDNTFIARYFNRSYKSHIEQFISDEKLCRILCNQWPFWGMPSDNSPVIYGTLAFYVHALEGSHYIEGGIANLADALAQAITRTGGEVRTGVTVTGMHTEQSLVRAIVTSSGEEVEAPLFVSNISPYILHGSIIPEHARNKLWLRRLRTLSPSVSAIALYCGLRYPVTFPGGSMIDFHFAGSDFAELRKELCNACHSDNRPGHLIFLQSPHSNEAPTMLLLAFCKKEQSSDWHGEKMRFAENLLASAEHHIPGLRDAIELVEIGTPETFERYTGNTGGALYGFANTKDIYSETRIPNTTHLANLYQTGHWCKPGGGIWNVMECGYTAAQIILRRQGGGAGA